MYSNNDMKDAPKSHSMRKRNDTGLRAVVITADADAVDIDPPKIRARQAVLFLYSFVAPKKIQKQYSLQVGERLQFSALTDYPIQFRSLI